MANELLDHILFYHSKSSKNMKFSHIYINCFRWLFGMARKTMNPKEETTP